jgi:hypothetical protein
MSKKENTKTEIVLTENVMLGREHVRFLEETMQKLERESGYKTTKSHILRLLIEGAMRRHLTYKNIHNEDELRMRLNTNSPDEATRISKR